MGYTHYFYRQETMNKTKWSKFTKELEMLKKNLPENGITAGCSNDEPAVICGWNSKLKEYDRNSSIIDGEIIALNGEGDLSHESLYIPRVMCEEDKKFSSTSKDGLRFGFTKTARKPYDTMVCLALISMKRWFMHKVRVSSDGDIEDWKPALDLYRKLTGIPITWDMLTMNPDPE
jgi:hypothetical protein